MYWLEVGIAKVFRWAEILSLSSSSIFVCYKEAWMSIFTSLAHSSLEEYYNQEPSLTFLLLRLCYCIFLLHSRF